MDYYFFFTLELSIFILIWTIFVYLCYKFTRKYCIYYFPVYYQIIPFVTISSLIAHMLELAYQLHYSKMDAFITGIPLSCSNSILEYLGFRKCRKHEDIMRKNILWHLSPINVMLSLIGEYISKILEIIIRGFLIVFDLVPFHYTLIVLSIFALIGYLGIFCKYGYSFSLLYGAVQMWKNRDIVTPKRVIDQNEVINEKEVVNKSGVINQKELTYHSDGTDKTEIKPIPPKRVESLDIKNK
uniref:XK-related protein n=1 Tax=Rhabditophanes sp. KR3021 TaxID=114890 RepID=A0AC35TV86_9BILA